jgi:hypothetical protein
MSSGSAGRGMSRRGSGVINPRPQEGTRTRRAHRAPGGAGGDELSTRSVAPPHPTRAQTVRSADPCLSD